VQHALAGRSSDEQREAKGKDHRRNDADDRWLFDHQLHDVPNHEHRHRDHRVAKHPEVLRQAVTPRSVLRGVSAFVEVKDAQPEQEHPKEHEPRGLQPDNFKQIGLVEDSYNGRKRCMGATHCEQRFRDDRSGDDEGSDGDDSTNHNVRACDCSVAVA
jgi:hypothetical protein